MAEWIGGDKIALACSTTLTNTLQRDYVIVVDEMGRFHWEQAVSGWVVGMFFERARSVLTVICGDGRCFLFGVDGTERRNINLPIEKISRAGCIVGKVILTSGTEVHLLQGAERK